MWVLELELGSSGRHLVLLTTMPSLWLPLQVFKDFVFMAVAGSFHSFVGASILMKLDDFRNAQHPKDDCGGKKTYVIHLS